jgi:hypothetical protein
MTPSEQSNALPVGEPADFADAEADSQAGDEALPHGDELREAQPSTRRSHTVVCAFTHASTTRAFAIGSSVT